MALAKGLGTEELNGCRQSIIRLFYNLIYNSLMWSLVIQKQDTMLHECTTRLSTHKEQDENVSWLESSDIE